MRNFFNNNGPERVLDFDFNKSFNDETKLGNILLTNVKNYYDLNKVNYENGVINPDEDFDFKTAFGRDAHESAVNYGYMMQTPFVRGQEKENEEILIPRNIIETILIDVASNDTNMNFQMNYLWSELLRQGKIKIIYKQPHMVLRDPMIFTQDKEITYFIDLNEYKYSNKVTKKIDCNLVYIDFMKTQIGLSKLLSMKPDFFNSLYLPLIIFANNFENKVQEILNWKQKFINKYVNNFGSYNTTFHTMPIFNVKLSNNEEKTYNLNNINNFLEIFDIIENKINNFSAMCMSNNTRDFYELANDNLPKCSCPNSNFNGWLIFSDLMLYLLYDIIVLDANKKTDDDYKLNVTTTISKFLNGKIKDKNLQPVIRVWYGIFKDETNNEVKFNNIQNNFNWKLPVIPEPLNVPGNINNLSFIYLI
jgi:hypothetical protein